MKTKAQIKIVKDAPDHPVRNLASVFQTRRNLVWEIERVVIKGTDLPLDLIDILCDLYGARHLGWTDPPANQDGFVTVRALRDGLVHSGALLSLRLKRLEEADLIEIQDVPKTGPGSEHRCGPRSSRSWVRIRPLGAEIAKVVWERYKSLGERLLKGVSRDDLAAHRRVNDIIRGRIENPASTVQ
jgi:DNA-binding MarR family transcriptional regulator